jgi:hypothetical protein
MTDLIRIVSSADGHTHPLDVPGYDAENPVTIPSGGNFDLLSVMSPETLHAMKDELSTLVTDGKLTSVQTITLGDLWNNASGGAVSGSTSLVNINETFPASAGAHSHQSVSADLTLEAGSGSNTPSNPKFLAGGMLSVHGASLTKASNYLAGCIGQYDISGTKATSYPAGAVLGMIADGTTQADGAFVAFTDGDSAVTQARAAYAVMNNNSNAGSGFAVGLDLQGLAHDGYLPVAYSTADIRLHNGTTIVISGDVITFHNPTTGHSATITMA